MKIKRGFRLKYKFGDLVGNLIYISESESNTLRKCIFKCECGKEFPAFLANVRKGNTKTCGCTRIKNSRKASLRHVFKYGDIVNKRITFISECESSTRRRKAIFLCECGNEFTSSFESVMGGRTKSCGCYAKQKASEANLTHGMAETAEYRAWTHMKGRCLNENDKNYYRYGARGIRICERWVNSFENFFEDMGLKPSNNHWIERIDNDGNYEPNNCMWLHKFDQASNKSTNKWIEHNGDKLTIAQWSRRIGISEGCLSFRIKNGWDIKKAIETPLRKFNK